MVKIVEYNLKYFEGFLVIRDRLSEANFYNLINHIQSNHILMLLLILKYFPLNIQEEPSFLPPSKKLR